MKVCRFNLMIQTKPFLPKKEQRRGRRKDMDSVPQSLPLFTIEHAINIWETSGKKAIFLYCSIFSKFGLSANLRRRSGLWSFLIYEETLNILLNTPGWKMPENTAACLEGLVLLRAHLSRNTCERSHGINHINSSVGFLVSVTFAYSL